jgi:hypothetical protein
MDDVNARTDVPATAEEAAPPPPPGCALQWQYLEDGKPVDGGTAHCAVADELHFECQGGPPFSLRWADIAQVQDDGVEVTLAMADGSAFRLSMLGRLHDNVLEAMLARWKKVNRQQALSEEALIASFRGQAALQGRPMAACGVGVYRTAVVLDFADGAVTRLPLVFTGRPERLDWTFRFTLPGETWLLGQLGRETDAFAAAVEGVMTALEAAAAERVRALCPQTPAMRQRSLAALLLDGRAASLRTARERCVPLADALVNSLQGVGLGTAWEALSVLGQPQDARIGEKADLQTDGVYRFFLLPVVLGSRAAVVFEASSGGDTGRATYVFRVEGGSAALEEAMDALNYALVCVNFRREPIYLSDEQLGKPQYARYLRSVERVPALAGLRRAYVGRAAHGEPAAWLAAVQALLQKV